MCQPIGLYFRTLDKTKNTVLLNQGLKSVVIRAVIECLLQFIWVHSCKNDDVQSAKIILVHQKILNNFWCMQQQYWTFFNCFPCSYRFLNFDIAKVVALHLFNFFLYCNWVVDLYFFCIAHHLDIALPAIAYLKLTIWVFWVLQYHFRQTLHILYIAKILAILDFNQIFWVIHL